MAKTKISEFDSNPANNTDIDSINIAEGCAPSGINNAIRELMSQLKNQQTGADSDNFTVGGNLTVTGTTTFTGIPSGPTASVGTNTTQLATTAFALANSVPTGVINMWGTATAPTGYLLCAGAAVSRSTYSALFAVIGTTFGSGDGSTTFNVPNYTSRFPYGTTLAATGGSADAVVVSHTHTATTTATDSGHTHASPKNGAPNGGGAGIAMCGDAAGNSPGYATTTGNANITAATTVASAGVSATNANLPPYLGINFIIKT
jgi:microcystin-dependent protein